MLTNIANIVGGKHHPLSNLVLKADIHLPRSRRAVVGGKHIEAVRVGGIESRAYEVWVRLRSRRGGRRGGSVNRAQRHDSRRPPRNPETPPRTQNGPRTHIPGRINMFTS